MISRRRFLQRTLAVAATASLTGAAAATPAFNIRAGRRVLILGAGLAGLSAARLLRQAGYTVTVLEARNRIGGRVFSHEIMPGLVIELGAEWVGASHDRLRALCEMLELPLQDNRFETHLLYKGEYSPAGSWHYDPAWKQTLQARLEAFQALGTQDLKTLDQTDWWRYLKETGISERDLDIRELADSTDFGESIRHVSAFSALSEYAYSSPYNEMDYKITGGNSRLPMALADRVGREHIRLGHKVVAVDQSGRGVRVSCDNGTQVEADALICSLPTYAISQIRWNPALPADQAAAIRALQYARIAKHATVFSRRFWPDEAFDLLTDVYGHYFYHGTKSQPGPAGALVSFTTGDKADVIGRQSQAFRRQMVADTLRPAFGEVGDLITRDMIYYWGNDPLTQGAYAMYGKGQYLDLQPVLQARFRRTLFAGEHLADWQGFMEGAVQTGEDAARELMG
ncbi:MAG: NAD(P)/FAD-dependent oxidoreductase [Bacteroidia bacterium]|nr:NAD(P)/FAD-dependent oxidoreductase [Bacteroidia bacterium]